MKLQRHTVDAVPLIRGRRVSLAFEDVAQMATAVRADDLGALHAEAGVRMPRDCAGDAVEVRGPAATGLEFVVRLVEGCVACRARVDALAGHVLVVFAREGGFGALFAEDAELFCK